MGTYNGKEYIWRCEICGEEFESRRKLEKHRKEKNHKLSTANKPGEFYCKYCNKKFNIISALHTHEKFCKFNDNREIPCWSGRQMSDEFKQQHSDIMKRRYIENDNVKPLSTLRKNKEHSYPEKWLIKVIDNEGIDSNYVCEYPFHTFSLDFLWPDKKKVIEMDGQLHKTSSYQIDCDRRKDELLKSEGYDLLRIDWKYCFNNPKEVINKIKEFLK